MRISIETFEDGKAAVRTNTDGFIPCGSKTEAEEIALGMKLGWNAAIYEARRAKMRGKDLPQATID